LVIPKSAIRNATGLEVIDEPRSAWIVSVPGWICLFRAGIGDEPFGQFRAFAIGDHPAHYITAEDVEDHIEIKVRPLRRTEQFRDVPAPELVGASGQQFALRVGRMDKLVATLPHFCIGSA